MATAVPLAPPVATIGPRHFAYMVAAFVVTGLVVAFGSLWALNFLHVFAGLLWTGIDLFMGFVIGPVLRSLDLPARRAFIERLLPRTLLLMPSLAAITGTCGWFLASRMGFLDLAWPQKGWVVGALVAIAILTVQGFLVLLPTNLKVYFEIRKDQPDFARVGRLMRTYVRVVAFQGAMQVAMIVIMAKFATGV